MGIKNQNEHQSQLLVMNREQLEKASQEELIGIIFSLIEIINRLEDSLAKLSRNSATSSKPPSSDITKPRPAGGSGERKQGAQAGQWDNTYSFWGSRD